MMMQIPLKIQELDF